MKDDNSRLAALVAILMVLTIGAALFLLVRADPGSTSTPDGTGWTQDRAGLSWTCTSEGQQIIRDDRTGSITAGDPARCDGAG